MGPGPTYDEPPCLFPGEHSRADLVFPRGSRYTAERFFLISHSRNTLVTRAAVVLALIAWAAGAVSAQIRLADQADREGFRSWFVFLADAQFYRPTNTIR